MKIISNDAVVNGGGSVFMVPQEPDDLQSICSCISKGDLVSTYMSKKMWYLQNSLGMIQFQVDTAEFDQKCSEIHIHGSIISEKALLSMRCNIRNVQITKDSHCLLTKTNWSESELDSLVRTSSSCSDSSGSIGEEDLDLAVVLIPEQGLANIFLAGKGGWPKICAKIKDQCPYVSGSRRAARKKIAWRDQEGEIPFPKQRPRAAAPTPKETNNDRFFGSILTAFHEHVDFRTIKHVVIAGPGGLKEKFHSYVFSEAKKWKLKPILDNKSRFLLVPTNSRNFKEILEMAAVKKFVKETEDVEDSNVMDELDFLNATDADRACYGYDSVEIANKLAAIRTLLITDDLFKRSEVATRKKYGTLIESVKKSGGTTRVLFCDRESGKRLGVLTGVAAILRFRIPDLDDIKL
ncbi:hypothetical protein ACHQM5_019797 [Ranunculus cassubicifolius]